MLARLLISCYYLLLQHLVVWLCIPPLPKLQPHLTQLPRTRRVMCRFWHLRKYLVVTLPLWKAVTWVSKALYKTASALLSVDLSLPRKTRPNRRTSANEGKPSSQSLCSIGPWVGQAACRRRRRAPKNNRLFLPGVAQCASGGWLKMMVCLKDWERILSFEELHFKVTLFNVKTLFCRPILFI